MSLEKNSILKDIVKKGYNWTEQDAHNRDEFFKEYGAIFQLENIDSLTPEKFREFWKEGYFHWGHGGSQNAGWLVKEEQWETTKKNLKIIVDESKSLSERIKNLRNSENGGKYFQNSTYTTILHMVDPQKHPTINDQTIDALDKLKLSSKNERKTEEWEYIPKLENTILKLCNEIQVDTWKIDWIWARFLESHSTQWWMISAGREEERETVWNEFRDSNTVGFYWNETGDLSKLNDDQIKKKFGQLQNDWGPGRDIKKIKKNDILFVKKGKRGFYGIGKATGTYQYNTNQSYHHTIPVQWITTQSYKTPAGYSPKLQLNSTMTRIPDKNQEPELVKYYENAINGKTLTSEEELDAVTIDTFDRALNVKPNLILYGPPGTGKTWMANEIAKKYLPGTFLERIIDELKERAEDSGYTFEKEGTRANQNLYVLKRRKEKVYEEIRVDFHVANTDYFQVNSGIEFFKTNKVGGVSGKNYLILVREKPESFLCLPYDVEQLYSKFVSEGDGTGGWDSTGEGKHSVHNLKINGTEAYFEPKDETSQTKDVSEFMNTWNYIDKDFEASNIGSNIFRVTFHPSYSYEDFVEGFRPNTKKKSNEQYVLEKGIFWKVCKIAKQYPKKKIVLIVDEINRGNIPKIFGELITLIEKDKRNSENSLKLTYSKDSFFVPENLIIIGTMNTADKSLMQMDDALKRRFVFEELMPDTKLLEDHLKENNVPKAEDYSKILKRINEKITGDGKNKEALLQFRDRQIGHSYFWNIGKENNPDEDLQSIIKYDIIPLLQDYFYGDYSKMKEILTNRDNEKESVGIIGEDNRTTELVNDISKSSDLKNYLLKI